MKDPWLTRSSKRIILESNGNEYLISGNILGDTFNEYNVIFSKTTLEYSCDCYSRSFGRARRSKVCTHVGKVLIRLYGKNNALRMRDKLKLNKAMKKYHKNPLDCFPKSSFWPSQREAIEDINEHFKQRKETHKFTGNGKSKGKYSTRGNGVIFIGPTGIGKSAINYSFLKAGGGGIYIAGTSNNLVSQLENDPDLDVTVMIGKSNYRCNYHNTAPEEGGCEVCDVWYRLKKARNQIDFMREDCRKNCEYYTARRRFEKTLKDGGVGVTNLKYFLLTDDKVPVIIVDECQSLSRELEELLKVRWE